MTFFDESVWQPLQKLSKRPNVAELFLEGVGTGQEWHVVGPHLKNQPIFIRQIMMSSKQHKSVMYQRSELAVSQRHPRGITDDFTSLVRHPNHRTRVNDDPRSWRFVAGIT